ncbi:MAG: antitoxin [Gammaproteobacteria bacterium]|nr:antitoxin [Gammaproteobacteria bacterium]MDE0270778.1 antitoxin [Gammaproteobacteria bacterium]
MRTTVTLDNDVADKLHDRMRLSGKNFKETLNDCLRLGLDQPDGPALAVPFVIEARSMKLRAGIELDDIGGILDFLDGPAQS